MVFSVQSFHFYLSVLFFWCYCKWNHFINFTSVVQYFIFSSLDTFYFFSCLISLAEASSKMMNRSDSTDNPMCRAAKRHRYKEQTFGFSGRRQGWNELREWHWNVYITICKICDQCKFDAWSRAPKAGALEQPRWMQ